MLAGAGGGGGGQGAMAPPAKDFRGKCMNVNNLI